jgi:hypothetical protein
MNMESHGGMILTRGNAKISEKTCPSATLSTTNHIQNVRFYVLTAASITIIAFWDIARCSFVDLSDDGGSKNL